ncbi:MAG: oxidoreductase [Caldithrix sp. RBG_13_44_9]|nr:MAG: oxidoreductase [Caldithrix sp. RBG_13_44_9]
MKFRKFGKTSWDVSEIGFGAWAIGGNAWGKQNDSDSLQALHKALDLGVNFIDTAQSYGNGHSESLIGQVLKERGEKIGNGSVKVATKIPPSDGHWPPLPYDDCRIRYSEKYLRQRVEFSLQKLGAEVLDLVQLHTWTRAWNQNPVALEILRELKKEGKILAIGISTPEHDQNSLNDLMKNGWLDAVQVIYNIFEQEPAAEFLPLAKENQVGVIVRVVFDEGSLTGKYHQDHVFHEGDFRRRYFKGDRLKDTLQKVEEVKKTIGEYGDPKVDNLLSVAARFALQNPAVSTVIPGMRNLQQAEIDCSFSELPPLNKTLYSALKNHTWRRAFWYGG